MSGSNTREFSHWDRALIAGASAGIGLNTAQLLAASGVHLILVARGEDRLHEVAAQLRDAHGVEVEVLAADIGNPEQLQVVEGRLRAEPAIDLLVNNAATTTFGAFVDSDVDKELLQLQVNTVAPLRLVHAVLPSMTARGRGNIVMVSSLDGILPVPFHATYSSTKSFLNHFAEALGGELKGTGIQVTTVMPGYVRTDMTTSAGMHDTLSDVPSLLILEPGHVARSALRAAARGQQVRVPGVIYTCWAAFVRVLPLGIRRRFALRIVPVEARQ